MKIIAEIGSNWTTLHDCIDSIDQAKQAGADAVKFQLFSAKELYGPNQHEMLAVEEHALDPKWLPELKLYANKASIEFMCTAFSVEGYNIVDKYVDKHKVASAEMNHPGILDFINSTGKEVLLSTGGSDLQSDVRLALLHLKETRVCIMFCVADYPAKIVDFRHLEMIKQFFGDNYDYGFSDHSIDAINIPILAKFHNIKYLEKHVSFIGTETPDSAHSLNFNEFKMLVQSVKEELEPSLSWELSNQDMRKLYRRRVVALKNIRRGDTLKLGDNVGIYRPMRGVRGELNPLLIGEYEKRRFGSDVTMGDVVCLSDLD